MNIYHKSIDLINLNAETDLDSLASAIILEEPLLDRGPTTLRRTQLKFLLNTLLQKIESAWRRQKFSPYLEIEAHAAPITCMDVDKHGTRILTASEDGKANLFDVVTGKQLMCFEGHSNVVNCATFNRPFSFLVATASFDKTTRIWDSEKGMLLYKLAGHEQEIIKLQFNPNGTDLATGSLDHTACIWDVETGKMVLRLDSHGREVVDLNYDHEGKKLITASVDRTARVWDIRTGKCMHTLNKHKSELSCATIDFVGDYYLTASRDKTAILWDAKTGKPWEISKGFKGEMITAEFSPSGDRFVAASDQTVKIFSVRTGALIGVLDGHDEEVVGAGWNAAGTKLYTLSGQKITLWDAETFEEMTVLTGHTKNLMMMRFNYEGDIIVSVGNDNICKVWKDNEAKIKAVPDNDVLGEEARLVDKPI